MNKTYDQFDYQAPSGSRILLHANPTTGELKKALISDFPASSITPLRQSLSDISNTTTSPEKIDSYIIPANTFTTNGQRLNMKSFITLAGGGSVNSIGYFINGATGNVLSSSASQYLSFEYDLIRIDTTHLRYSVQTIPNFSPPGLGIFQSGTLTFSNTIEISLYVTGNAIGSIIQKYSTIYFFKS